MMSEKSKETCCGNFSECRKIRGILEAIEVKRQLRPEDRLENAGSANMSGNFRSEKKLEKAVKMERSGKV